MTLRFSNEQQFRDWQKDRKIRIDVTSARSKVKDRRNKLEKAYGEYLALLKRAGDIAWYSDHEPIKVRLADGAWFTPDYVYIGKDGILSLVDVKGFYREASKVRIKVAARLYPFFRWVAATRKGGAWNEQVF